MNKRLVFRSIGRLLLVEAALLLPSVVVSLAYGEADTLAFLITIALCAGAGGLMGFGIKARSKDPTARDGLAIAGLSWVALSFFGALPFLFSGAIPHLADAFFESVSGFTTTGATILSEVESLPHGILFWRSFTHWIGGMGVLVLTLALLPHLTGRTAHLARAESPGPTFTKLLPKMGDTAKMLYMLYAALTVIQGVTLIIAGMPVFDAVIHTFGTAGTGGFSNRNLSVGAYNNPVFEWIIAIFMFLFGVNFSLYFLLLRKQIKPALRNEELLLYGGITLGATLIITLSLLPTGSAFFTALRHAFFQVTSIMSTTGYATANFDLWPQVARLVLVILMIGGACGGSTAGGLKMSRVLMLFKSSRRELQHTLHPRKVSVVRMDGKTVQESTLAQLGIFAFLYALLFLLGAFCVSLEGVDMVTSITASLTCLSNVGPGLSVVGPMGNFGLFSAPVKLVLSLIMLAGRLEIYPLLLLFYPAMWKKAS